MQTVTIKPSKGFVRLGAKELWEFRELLYFLTWRDIKVRYKQTVLGASWAVIQPVLFMLVFSLFLGRVAGIRDTSVPYPLFVFAGLVPWTLFSQTIVGASDSLVESTNLISKVYFPRLLLPASAGLSYLLDFFLALGVLGIMMVYYRAVPTQAILLLPLFAILVFVAALAVGIFLAAVNVKYRDVRYAVPFLVQVWLFVSPVAYSSSLIRRQFGEDWLFVYGLNPMAGVIEGFRWALLRQEAPPAEILLLSGVITLALLFASVAYFRKTERTFADVI